MASSSPSSFLLLIHGRETAVNIKCNERQAILLPCSGLCLIPCASFTRCLIKIMTQVIFSCISGSFCPNHQLLLTTGQFLSCFRQNARLKSCKQINLMRCNSLCSRKGKFRSLGLFFQVCTSHVNCLPLPLPIHHTCSIWPVLPFEKRRERKRRFQKQRRSPRPDDRVISSMNKATGLPHVLLLLLFALSSLSLSHGLCLHSAMAVSSLVYFLAMKKNK